MGLFAPMQRSLCNILLVMFVFVAKNETARVPLSWQGGCNDSGCAPVSGLGLGKHIPSGIFRNKGKVFI